MNFLVSMLFVGATCRSRSRTSVAITAGGGVADDLLRRGGGWFVVLATGSAPRPLRLAAAVRDSNGFRTGRRLRCLQHAIVMALMMWMFSAVPATASMVGMAGMPTPVASASASSRPLAGVGAVYCLAAALSWADRTSAPHTDRRDDAIHGAMTALLITLG
jgi:hypothetical protein